MKRRTSTKPIGIYEYGAIPPRIGGEHLSQYLREAARYYNSLVEIERERRQALRELQLKESPKLARLERQQAEIEEQIEGVLGEIRKTDQRAGARIKGKARGETTPLKDELKSLRAQLKSLRDQTKPLRAHLKELIAPADVARKERKAKMIAARGAEGNMQEVSKINTELDKAMGKEKWPSYWKKIRAIERRAHERRAEARSGSGIAAGTYEVTEEAVAAAFKKVPIWEQPQFHHFDGSGRVALRFSGDDVMTVKELESGDDPRLSLLPAPQDPNRTRKAKATDRILRMRVGFSAERTPLIVEMPVVLHRPLPSDAMIKRAWILARREGGRIRYKFQCVIESELFGAAKPGVARKGVAHVRLGWARRPDGALTIATWAGSDAASGELVLAAKDVDARNYYWEKIDGWSDRHFELVRDFMVERLKTHPVDGYESAHVAKWRAHGKLHALVEKMTTIPRDDLFAAWSDWKAERKAAGLDLFAMRDVAEEWATARGWSAKQAWLWYLFTWRRKDDHMRAIYDGGMRRWLLRRREQYRLFATMLSRRYATVELRAVALDEIARRPKPGEADEQYQLSRRHRTIAACSEVKAALKLVFCERYRESEDVAAAAE